MRTRAPFEVLCGNEERCYGRYMPVVQTVSLIRFGEGDAQCKNDLARRNDKVHNGVADTGKII